MAVLKRTRVATNAEDENGNCTARYRAAGEARNDVQRIYFAPKNYAGKKARDRIGQRGAGAGDFGVEREKDAQEEQHF